MEIFGGASTLVLPIVIIVLGALLWWYAKRCDANGWLN